MHAFVTSKTEDTLEVAPVIPIWHKERFMRIKKKVKVPTIQLKQSNKEDEEDVEFLITIASFVWNHPPNQTQREKPLRPLLRK